MWENSWETVAYVRVEMGQQEWGRGCCSDCFPSWGRGGGIDWNLRVRAEGL